MRAVLTLLAALSIAVTVPASAQQSGSNPQFFAASPAATVKIGTAKGDYDGGIDVRIAAWNKPQISLKRTLHNLTAADVTTAIQRSGASFEITTAFHGKPPHSGGLLGLVGGVDSGNVGVKYELYVPVHSRITLAIKNGNVDVEGVTGALDGGTNNGNVSVAGAGGWIHLNTNNGNIDVSIASLTQPPSIDLDTTNGNIDLRVPAGFAAPVRTSVNNGDVTNPFASSKGPGSVSLSTNNGDITVKRP